MGSLVQISSAEQYKVLPLPEGMDPFDYKYLPVEIALKILSYLTDEELRIAKINKRWQTLASKVIKLNEVQLPSFMVDGALWKTHLGNPGAVLELPSNILETLNSPCPFWPHMRVRDTHILGYKTDSLNGAPLNFFKFIEFVEKPLKGNLVTFKALCNPKSRNKFFQNHFGNKPFDKGEWILMTKFIIPGSYEQKGFNPSRHMILQKYSEEAGVKYESPKFEEILCLVLPLYVSSGKAKTKLLTNRFTCLYERNESLPILIGLFYNSDGLRTSQHLPIPFGTLAVRKA